MNRYLSIPIVFYLTACSSTLRSFDATEAVQAQDSCFAGTAPCSGVDKFDPFVELQSAFETTNVGIRQAVIHGDIDRAVAGVLRLDLNGYHAEGPAYAEYIRAAFIWAGLYPLPEISVYNMLAGPDSTVRVPEARREQWFVPSTVRFYRDAHYMVIRTDSTFHLFDLNTNFSLSRNFHFHPMFHAEAKKIAGAWIWIMQPRPYGGYDASAILQDECEQDPSLPCGVFAGAWRMKPPVVRVIYASEDSVKMLYGKSTSEWRKK